MIKIGLSGTRFSGKNKVANLFNEISIPVFDADLVIRLMLVHEYNILAEIRDKVGAQYFKHGKPDAYMIEKDGVFNKIIAIMEPILFDAYYNFENKNKGSIYTIFSSSILFERKWNREMDYNISVYSPFSHRVERAKKIKEKGLETLSSIKLYLNKEVSELSKNSLADHVIHNYNEFNIRNQVDKIDQKIIDLYLKKEYNKELP